MSWRKCHHIIFSLVLIASVSCQAAWSVASSGGNNDQTAQPSASDDWQTHLHLGISLAQSGDIKNSSGQLEKALALKPDRPETWLALAGLYQANGNIQRAIDIAAEYLRRYPNGADINHIREYMQYLQSELRQLNADNGGSFVRGNEKLARWLSHRMPLRVFINSANANSANTQSYVATIKAAFNKWSKLSQGRVSFAFIDSARGSDIECFLTSSTDDLHRAFAAGETRWIETTDSSLRANVYLLTLLNGRPLSDSRFWWLCLHEIGHALGLQHSMHPEDIMFISMPMKDEHRTPSARDSLSLIHLYPGS